MRTEFSSFYQLTPEQFEHLWTTALIVVDANVLLNLYRLPKGASGDLLGALDKVKDRLWVPHQVGLEYQANRLSVIAGQIRNYADVKKALVAMQSSLTKNLNELQLRKRHPTIDPDLLSQTVAETIKNFEVQLGELEKGQTGITGPDPLRDSIESLFEGRLGSPPSDQAELDEIYKRGIERYKRKIPPGYEDERDKEKEGSRSHNGLNFERKFGDLIVWEQLLKEAKARQAKSVIFVTDDDKEDWWWIVDANGEKKLGPRRELVEEMRVRASVEVYYQYSSEGFLKYASEYLGTEVKPQSIEQVREVSRLSRESRRRTLGSQSVEIVVRWLKQMHPDASVTIKAGYPDIVVRDKNRRREGYEVQYLWDYSEMHRRTSEKFMESLLRRPQSAQMPITFVFITADHDMASELSQRLQFVRLPFRHLIGVVDESPTGISTFEQIF